ncbi:MAG: hypothetical protein AMXMBFR33_01130 [Candidatus Xenobia bacterium]
MPTCPFLNRECFAECALYAPGIQGCSFVAQTMLLEDIHKISVLAYDRYLKPPGAPAAGTPEGESEPPPPPAPPARD